MPKTVIPERIKKKIQKEIEASSKSKKYSAETIKEYEIEEQEIFIPLSKPEFEDSLKWLHDILDIEISKREYDPWHDQEGTHDILLKPNSEPSKFAYEKEEFLKLFNWLMFEKPNQTHEFWFIPKDFTREELVIRKGLMKDMLHSVDILNAKGIDFTKCKGCSFPFSNLRLHLKKNSNCFGSYSQMDMEQLNELLNSMTRARKSEWYFKNKENVSQNMAKYHQENRGRILQRMKDTSQKRRKYRKLNP